MKTPARIQTRRQRHTLAIDIGGTHVKLRVSNRSTVHVFDSSKAMTPVQMMRTVRNVTKAWSFDCVSLGYPGIVVDGRIVAEPLNLGAGWTTFNFEAAFKRPVRIMNDAVMQAIGAYQGGRILFLGFGTALGAVAILDSKIYPMELAYVPFNKRVSAQAFVGDEALHRLGAARWSKNVLALIKHLSRLLDLHHVIIGGGNAARLKRLPRNASAASSAVAFDGGFRVWRGNRARPPAC